MPALIAKVTRQANELAKATGFVTPDNAEVVLGFAEVQAKAVLEALKKKGYSES
jgi:hypothetical protein